MVPAALVPPIATHRGDGSLAVEHVGCGKHGRTGVNVQRGSELAVEMKQRTNWVFVAVRTEGYGVSRNFRL